MSDSQPGGFFNGSPKMIFIFGLVSGIAVMSLLGGEISLPSAAGTGSGTTITTNTGTGNTGAAAAAGTATKGELAAITSDDWIKGDLKKAKVVIVEYSDFECPFCERHHPTMQALSDKYGDDVAWVYRHYPLSFHPEAKPAAIASECAGQQDKFWEFADAMFENQDQLGEDFYVSTAEDLGLNVSKFETCLDSDEAAAAVAADQATGNAAGVTGTPATFINGQMVVSSSGNSVGAAPQATFESIIDGLLD